jgi:uncharacterized RDD family membrane protein YckC
VARPGSAPPFAVRPGAAPPGYTPPTLAPNGAPLAEFSDRLLARLIDMVILGGATVVVLVPLFVIAFVYVLDAGQTVVRINPDPFAPTPPELRNTGFVVTVIITLALVEILIALAFAYIYDVEMMFRSGQTIGKRVMKLRVVPVDPSAALTRRVATKRFLVQHVAAALVPLFSWLDGLWQLWDQPLRQCLHDKFAATVVVSVNRPAGP